MMVSVAPLGSITFSSFLVITVVLSGIVFSANAVEPQFNDPKGLGVDLSGNVFVADTDNNRIQKFTGTGKFIRKWGSMGENSGNFKFPTYVAVDSSGNVFVVDNGNNRIQKFTNTGKFIRTWGSAGTDDGSFSFPTGISVDSNDNVYVNDGANLRIQKFTNTGKFIRTWGSVGSGDGQFLGPWGLGIDLSTDKVYMTDVGIPGPVRVQEFTKTGEFIRSWGTFGTASLIQSQNQSSLINPFGTANTGPILG